MEESRAATGLEWREKFELSGSADGQEDSLREAIETYLKNCAITSYTVTQNPVLTIALEDVVVQRTVISAIEWFLFAEDPVQGKKKLSELSSPPTLCGKVFKNSEPTYSCRDCAHDATCVLCMTCFGRSIHKNHNYRLSTSSGGGCCDCGDEEAWKQGASCEIHSAKSDDPANEDLLKKLPGDLLQRAKCLFSILLDFCVQVICDPNEEELLANLPAKTKNEDTHVTLLYNDESHTFHNVISALRKTVPHCTPKLGSDFAIVVDREGRSSVFTGSLSMCNQITASITENTSSRNSGPLRCETAHIYTVACQLMALKLMRWLSDMTEVSDCLRRLHATVCTTSGYGNPSHLARVLRADGKLWKVARSHNHQVFMNILLKDPYGKVALAIEFTKNYPTIIDDYYKDDQDHSISAAAMSVQLFTVPSLAQLLTVNHGLMEIVMGVLLEKTGSYVKENGVIDFGQDEHDNPYRLLWVIHDLRYVVQNKPNEWNEQLKKRFYKFLELFLRMFRRFQGLGLVKRARGIHVEIEPEWLRDYKFELRLINLVPFILRWCETDKDVLLKSIALTMECLKDIRKSTGATKRKKYHDGKKTVKVFDFDVSSEEVSMHIPIVRFLAGLIGCCQKHSINIRDVLDIKKDEDALIYLEYPLKVLVFAAQVNSGMWKRNGYSILHQVIAHRKDNPAETYDKDIFLMQVLASCMGKDYFLHVVLDMFQLHPWASANYDIDKMDESALNQQLSLAGEFLHLLIIILGERYNNVVGHVDSESAMKREVVHRLCLGDMSRSELIRRLSYAESEFEHAGEIDGIIASVATFKKPGVTSKGLYKMKKEYIPEFNPFFYHYDKNEQSKAEDNLRKKCKEEEIPAVFTPPVPVEFVSTYSSIVDLLSSKTMIGLLTVLLWRIKHVNPKSWTDRILHEVLHLIGLALHEETRQRKMGKSFGFVSAATERHHHVPKHCSLFECLDALQGEQIVQPYSGFLVWTIQKFTEEQSIQNGTGKPTVQSSPPLDVSSETRDEEELHRKKQSQERRERILQQMSNMQKAFIRQNSELYLSTNSELADSWQDETDSTITSHSEQPVIAIGNNRSPPVTVLREQFICILCQENPTSSERPLVYSAYVQRSTLLSNSSNQDLETGDKADPLVSCRDQRVGTHVGSCGHVMHGDCWQRFFESISSNDRLSLRPRARITSFDLTKREFLCPLCSGLGNTVVPIVYPNVPEEPENSKSNYISWVATFQKIDSMLTKDFIEFCQSEKSEDLWSLKSLKERIWPLICGSNDMQSMITVFSRAVYTFGLNVLPDDDDCRVPLMVWASCAYTLQCFEHSSRDESSGIVSTYAKREIDMLKSLVSVAKSVSSINKRRDIVKNGLRLISLIAGSDILQPEPRSMIDVDIFDWMVKMRFSLPSIVDLSQPADGLSSVELDGFVFHLAVAANIIQLLLSTPRDIPSDEMDEDTGQDAVVAEEMANLWKVLRHLCNPAAETSSHPNPQRLLAHVRYRLLPFLRCCAVYFFILNSTRVPLALREKFATFDKEFDSLAEYLALPRNLTELFGWSSSENTFTDEIVSKIVRRWCTNVSIVDSSPNLSSRVLIQKSLVKLPNNYSELIIQASQYECPLFSGEDNRVPAKCLVCGKWLCSEGWCCKKTVENQNLGSCTAHAVTCGAGVGIFLRVADCIILLLNGVGKGCFYPSPYLDAYGENDPGLRRGNPLYLCEERYQRLQKLWRQHGIASEIVRHLEANRQMMQVDWTNY